VRLPAYLQVTLGFWLLLGNGLLHSEAVDRSVSASRQFIVYGTTAPLRGAIAQVAENTKANVLNLLQQRDEWKTPIILNLQFPQANVPELPLAAFRFSQTGSGLKIQIDLTIADDFDAQAVRRQVLRAILLEMIYRHAPNLPAGAAYLEPPDWLIEGLLAAEPFHDRSAMLDTIGSLVTENRIMTLDQFLQQNFGLLDPSGQVLYRAYALAFLQLLMSDTGGSARLGHYLDSLSEPSADPVESLKLYFPILARSSEVDALWRTSVASLTTRKYELLTVAETERQLDELLGPATSSSNIKPQTDAFLAFQKKRLTPAELANLHQLQEKLLLLGMKANPTLRGLVMEYEAIAERLFKHKTKGIAARLKMLATKRAEIKTRMAQADDFMNWYEATQADSISGAFTGYLRAATQAEEIRSRRRDPISVYLDALEEQF
jgi:hypothetical protein